MHTSCISAYIMAKPDHTWLRAGPGPRPPGAAPPGGHLVWRSPGGPGPGPGPMYGICIRYVKNLC